MSVFCHACNRPAETCSDVQGEYGASVQPWLRGCSFSVWICTKTCTLPVSQAWLLVHSGRVTVRPYDPGLEDAVSRCGCVHRWACIRCHKHGSSYVPPYHRVSHDSGKSLIQTCSHTSKHYNVQELKSAKGIGEGPCPGLCASAPHVLQRATSVVVVP